MEKLPNNTAAEVERHEFAARLVQALQNAGYSTSATELAREFSLRSDGTAVTVHAARKWLFGEAIPTQEKIKTLAAWLSVSADWLRFGSTANHEKVGRPQASKNLSKADNRLLADFHALNDADRAMVHEVIRIVLRRGRKS